MKLLVVCPTLSDNALAASFRLIHLLRHFLENGVIVKVYLHDSEISKSLKEFQKQNLLEVKIIPLKQNIVRRIINKTIGVPDSLISWGNEVKSNVFENESSNNYDAILTSSPPHSLQVIGMKISKKLNIKHFTDFRDDWMGSHRLVHLTPLHAYLSQKFERLVLENSTVISHAIPFVANEWMEKYPKLRNKIHPLSNGFSKDTLNYKENDKTVKYNKNVIAYFGGNYNNFVTEKLSQLRQELIDSKLSGKWMIVSGGPFEIPYSDDDVWKHFGNIPQNEVYNYMYNSNIHISLLPPGDLFPSRTIPLKLYTQITTKGACVFIGNNGATSELFKDVEDVYFLGASGWETLINWIKENETDILSRNIQRANIDRFSYESIGGGFLKLFFRYFN